MVTAAASDDVIVFEDRIRFFRSLAQDQRGRSIGIVLSGTASDGTLGVRATKGEGGMVMAQSPDSTEFDGMPRNAIATGLVDYVLPPQEMPAALIAYAARAFGNARYSEAVATPGMGNNLKRVFVLLRSRSGHGFSLYRPNSIMRRRTGRAVPGPSHRIWSPGCSTGEEAYSAAILLQEAVERLDKRFGLQVFATDIDPQAIAVARSGIYPSSIAANISQERLARFFYRGARQYATPPISYCSQRWIGNRNFTSAKNRRSADNAWHWGVFFRLWNRILRSQQKESRRSGRGHFESWRSRRCCSNSHPRGWSVQHTQDGTTGPAARVEDSLAQGRKRK
ncbi:MAG: hypothetical protein EA384_07910 [Spirochaetaceae bacterium]|nr:MAG: hypothetical protein EA384_07910 [Spirochaetaceae bacterium]